jgi:hypothetical protein
LLQALGVPSVHSRVTSSVQVPRDRAADNGHAVDQVAVAQRDGQGELRALDRAVVAMVRQNECIGRAQRHR